MSRCSVGRRQKSYCSLEPASCKTPTPAESRLFLTGFAESSSSRFYVLPSFPITFIPAIQHTMASPLPFLPKQHYKLASSLPQPLSSSPSWSNSTLSTARSTNKPSTRVAHTGVIALATTCQLVQAATAVTAVTTPRSPQPSCRHHPPKPSPTASVSPDQTMSHGHCGMTVHTQSPTSQIHSPPANPHQGEAAG
jgi:hypothetical protein